MQPLTIGTHRFAWGRRTFVMGILNITPDSFSGDGLLLQTDQVVERARAMVAEGADILDIGGESTRPGHTPVDASEELERVIPSITAIASAVDVPLSIDTSKATVAEAALKAGASIVNDVRGLMSDPEIASVAANAGVPVVLMHDLTIPGESQLIPDIVRELGRRIDHAVAAGIPEERIVLDPGFGFGKTAELNLRLLHRLRELTVLGLPILSGTSRKSTIGKVLNVEANDRVEGTAATVSLAIANGADIVRVHDVREMTRVARMTDAIVRGRWRESS